MANKKMANDLFVTLVQTDLIWENSEKNRNSLEKKLSILKDNTDLILLPEMFTTGFSMNAQKLAERAEGPALEWMQKMASKFSARIMGSWIVKDDGGIFNRLHSVSPDGSYTFYDKRHLFRMAGEDEIFSNDNKLLTVEINGWNVRPLICYDLRFPVWSRCRNNDYDLLVYLANWPKRRIDHWKLLLQARAVENQAYTAGVNRIGRDGNKIEYPGSSMIFDPLGNTAADLRSQDGMETTRLSRAVLDSFRTKFPVWKDADDFEIK